MRCLGKHGHPIYKTVKMTRLQPKVKLHFKLPTSYNNGSPVDENEFISVKNYFLRSYGGLSTSAPSFGYWMNSKVTYKDETIEYMILIEKERFHFDVEPDLPKVIKRFKDQFQQLEISCHYHDVVST